MEDNTGGGGGGIRWNIGKTDIILKEGDEIIQEDSEVAKVLSDFFSSAIKSLDVEIRSENLEESVVSDDTIDKIIQ